MIAPKDFNYEKPCSKCGSAGVTALFLHTSPGIIKKDVSLLCFTCMHELGIRLGVQRDDSISILAVSNVVMSDHGHKSDLANDC